VYAVTGKHPLNLSPIVRDSRVNAKGGIKQNFFLTDLGLFSVARNYLNNFTKKFMKALKFCDVQFL